MSRARILESAGFVRPSELPRGPNGRPLCRWCGAEVPKPNRTFCSGARATFEYRGLDVVAAGHGCVHEHLIRSQPGYARKLVRARDRGVCAACGVDALSTGWEMDHILPVVEGGGACGLENLRTLCTTCHRLETAALAARRAAARKARVA